MNTCHWFADNIYSVHSYPKGMSFLSNFTYSKLMQTSNNSINRDSLQEAYIESIIDGMDHKSMYQYVYDNLTDHLDKYSVDELITEVEDYYPELLEQNNDWSLLCFLIMALTYKQLLHQLLDLTPEQLDCTPTVYDSETDEYLPIKQFLIATDEDQVLDEAHPFFSLSQPTQTINKMDPIDLSQLKQNYVDLIIDGMDIDALCEFACSALSNTYDGYSEEQIVGEIKEFYGEETLDDLMPKSE